MSLRGKKLGVLLSVPPDHANFHHTVRLTETALANGVDVYLYCIDEAVKGVDDLRLQKLKMVGLKLFACAYGAQRRGVTMADNATFAGLTIVSDVIAATDHFVSFN
jgi:sulfur relay (sulfurtransferase) complex TusBCD TusD component (DsrE family)